MGVVGTVDAVGAVDVVGGRQGETGENSRHRENAWVARSREIELWAVGGRERGMKKRD